jgi:membrane protein CcdC involved in cytochrome C biogenesis
MAKTSPKLRLSLYAVLAAMIMLLVFVVFVLQINEPIVRWAELYISRFLR